MKILIVGAGGVGGYFGARMIEAGADVTFLLRPQRRSALAQDGLVVLSPLGDIRLSDVKAVTKDELQDHFDLALVSCKAQNLDSVISDLHIPGGLERAIVLPLLNGIRHYDHLDRTFGPERVAGGLCRIAATMNPAGEIRHLNDHQQMVFGPRHPSQAATLARFEGLLRSTRLDIVHSTRIMTEAWRKFVELSTLAAVTCLMRASIGCINRTDEGSAFITEALGEAASVGARYGYPIDPADFARAQHAYHDPALPLTASMLRDLEADLPTEAEHIIADMYHRGRVQGLSMSIFRLAWLHHQARDNRLAEELGAKG